MFMFEAAPEARSEIVESFRDHGEARSSKQVARALASSLPQLPSPKSKLQAAAVCKCVRPHSTSKRQKPEAQPCNLVISKLHTPKPSSPSPQARTSAGSPGRTGSASAVSNRHSRGVTGTTSGGAEESLAAFWTYGSQRALPKP